MEGFRATLLGAVYLAAVPVMLHIIIPHANGQADLFDQVQLQSLLSRAVEDDGLVNPSLLLREVVQDPLPVPDFNISSGGTFTQIDGQLRNARLLGLRGLQINNILINVGQMNLTVEMSVPMLRMEGDYDLQGYVTFVNIDGGGPFWMNLTNFKAYGGTSLGRNQDGLHVKNIHVDAGVESIDLHFENLMGGGGWSTVSNALLNQLSGLIFDQVRETAVEQLQTTIEKEVNSRLRDVPTELLTLGSNDTIVDELLLRAGEHMELMGVEPMSLPDMDETFNRRVLFMETTGNVRLHNGVLYGLSTIYRTGDLLLNYDNNSLSLVVNLGFHNLTGTYDWNVHLMGIGPAGKLTLSMNKLSVFLKTTLEMRTGKRPKILDLRLDHIGQIWLDVQGLGTLDYLLEVVINLVTNALKHNIAEAVLSPVREAIQFQLDNFPLEFLTV